MAHELGLSPQTVKDKVKGLEKKGVIQGDVTFLNPKETGHLFFKICIYLKDYWPKKQSFLDYCAELPNVIHIIESLGPWEVEAASIGEFYDMTHDIRNRFPQIVSKIDYVIILEEKKLDFLPEWY